MRSVAFNLSILRLLWQVTLFFEMRTGMENINIQPGFEPGEGFAEIPFEAEPGRDLPRGKPDRFHAVGPGQEDRPFAMELLGHDDILAVSEEIAGSQHGVQGPESGIIHQNVLFRDPETDQFVFHVLRLVVTLPAVVAGDYDPADLSAPVKFGRGFDPGLEIFIQEPSLNDAGGPEQQGTFLIRQLTGVGIDKPGAAGDLVIGI